MNGVLPDGPLSLGQMMAFWSIVSVGIFVALLIGDAIARGRE